MNPEAADADAGKVAIVGRPNVGKSALFNRLAGRNIAIVHNQPGITRDRLAARSKRGARPFLIWDTGGIGGAGEVELATEVRAAAEAAMRESDVILFVVDAQHGLAPIDQELAIALRKSRRPVVLVVNKIDDPKHEALEADFAALGFPRSIMISAAHGRGINELLQTIDELLPATSNEEAPAGEAEPPPVALAIIGRPNAGKSSLINAVLQDQRTIVSNIPGTTRDAIDVAYERAGRKYVLIDTAGMRARSKHSTSVEVFSVMRAERTIRRADLCVLVIDITSGVSSQDKRIAGLIQEARKPSLVVLNKWDLVKPARGARAALDDLVARARAELFFLHYAPVLVASATTGENVDRLFAFIGNVERAAGKHIGTGVLNRMLRAAMGETLPPTIGNKRLKLFYATQAAGDPDRAIDPPKFILFVNQPKLLSDTYARYIERRIRELEPYPGLPVILTPRARTETRED